MQSQTAILRTIRTNARSMSVKPDSGLPGGAMHVCVLPQRSEAPTSMHARVQNAAKAEMLHMHVPWRAHRELPQCKQPLRRDPVAPLEVPHGEACEVAQAAGQQAQARITQLGVLQPGGAAQHTDHYHIDHWPYCDL